MEPAEDTLGVQTGIQDLKGRSARGALITFGSQALRYAISFGSQIYLAHLLTPAQFGIVAMAAPVLGFILIFMDLGLSQAVIQRQTITQRELSALFWINVAMSLGLSALMIALSPVAQWVYHEPRVGPVVIALALLLPISGLSSQAVALLSRKLAFLQLAAIDLSAAVCGAGAAIAAALMGAGYWALVVQQIAISLVTLVLVWPLSKWLPSRPRIERGVGSLIRFGGHLTAFNVVTYFTMYFDNALVGIFSGASALGLFERAFKLVLQPIAQITAPLGRVALPMLSRLVGNDLEYRRTWLRMLEIVLFVTTPGLLCASLLAREVVLALLGPAWLGTAPILAWLSIAGAVSAYTTACCWLLITQGRVREQMHCGFISSGLILVSLFCGLHWGPVGIAAAYAFFSPAVHGVYVWTSTHRGPVALADLALASYPIVAAVPAIVAALWFLRHFAALPPLAMVCAGCVASYVATILMLFVIPAGNRMLREVVSMRRLLLPSRA
jgi:PST family polysaccharide transporter